MHSRKAIALVSLVFTYLFFFEYIPPFRWVHIPYDLNGFHYPLADYAFQRLRQGQFPLWDPTIYCGMSFVGNIQAALFYPPTWLMFAFNIGRDRLSYQSMQDVLLLHVWMGFLLCYLWLRGKRLAELPCILGAGVFAYSGYLCTQLQHFGLVGGYVWLPLALWGIDQAVEGKSWRPLWKVAAASALSFLAGYPPTWIMFAMVVGIYALAGPWRWKASLGTVVSLGVSLSLCAIQILPTLETTGLREPEAHYGLGIRDWDMLLSYTVPNYFNFSLNMPPNTNPSKDYFYLGVPALLGLPFLLLRRRFRDLVPPLAILAASLVMAGNPYDIVWSVVQHSGMLADVVRSWYFLAGVTLAFALLTAYALDHFLERTGRPLPSWVASVSLALMATWSGYELFRWKTETFAVGWNSGFDVLATLAIFGAGMYAVRVAQGRRRIWMTAALILFVGVDYKAFGTSKRFDAGAGDAMKWSSSSLPGMEPDVFQELSNNTGYRIVVDVDTGPLPNDLRHIGWITPQGFDPLLTTPFRKMVETYGHFQTDRIFDVDPENYAALQLFGVRYVISAEQSPMYPKLKDNPHFQLLGSIPTFYKVYEYLDAQPPYSWEGRSDAQVQHRQWGPERRVLEVHSLSEGKVTLHEQSFPGWTATVDGKSAAVETWMGAFQAVRVPAGEHTVEFLYGSRFLGIGGAISLFALIGLAFWIWERKRGQAALSTPALEGEARSLLEGTE